MLEPRSFTNRMCDFFMIEGDVRISLPKNRIIRIVFLFQAEYSTKESFYGNSYSNSGLVYIPLN